MRLSAGLDARAGAVLDARAAPGVEAGAAPRVEAGVAPPCAWPMAASTCVAPGISVGLNAATADPYSSGVLTLSSACGLGSSNKCTSELIRNLRGQFLPLATCARMASRL